MHEEYQETNLVLASYKGAVQGRGDAIDCILGLDPQCFEGIAPQAIWSVMRTLILKGKPVTEAGIRLELARAGELGPDGMYWNSYRDLLMGGIDNPQPLHTLREGVKDAWVRREIKRICMEKQAELADPTVAGIEVATAILGEVEAVTSDSNKGSTWADVTERFNTTGQIKDEATTQGAWSGLGNLDAIYPFPSKGMTVIAARPNVGKCWGYGTKIMMFDGTIKEVQYIVDGDTLMGPDSMPRTATGITRGTEMMYRVTLRNGDSFVCNESHILSLRMSSSRQGYIKGQVVNIELRDYLNKPYWFKHQAKCYKSGELNWSCANENLTVPPYILGIWLGDGTSKQASLTGVDESVHSDFLAWGNSMGVGGRIRHAPNGCRTTHLTNGCSGGLPNPATTALRELGVINNKHIPARYLKASVEDRLQLLAGLIDTDGSKAATSYDIITKFKPLADDIQFLCRSLGFSCTFRECKKTCCNNGAVGTYYRGSISGDIGKIPVRIGYKSMSDYTRKKSATGYSFKVEPIGVGDYYGFAVDRDHLFLLADFTVAHNTLLGMSILDATIKRGNKVVWINMDMAEDIARTKLVSCVSGVEYDKIMNGWCDGGEVAKVKVALEMLSDLVEFVHFPAFTSFEKVRAATSQALRRTGATCMILDQFSQIGLERKYGDKDYAKRAYVSTSYKNLAQTFGVAAIVLAQINRQGSDGEPGLQDLAETGSLEQDAAGVIVLWPTAGGKIEPSNGVAFGSQQKVVKFQNSDDVMLRLAKSQIGPVGHTMLLKREGAISRFKYIERHT